MARAAYPTDADVAGLCSSIALPNGFTFAGYAAAGVDEWERRTAYHPFLGSGFPQTRSYDPPGPNRRSQLGFSLFGGGRVLDVGCGLYGVNSVTVGAASVGSPSEVPGTVLVANQDFWAEPVNAPAMKQPWQRIRFLAPVFGTENSVLVNGLFGYGAEIPEDAWQAIARLGAALGLEAVLEGLRQGATRWSEEDVRESFDHGLIAGLGSSFRSSAERVLMGYRRVSL